MSVRRPAALAAVAGCVALGALLWTRDGRHPGRPTAEASDEVLLLSFEAEAIDGRGVLVLHGRDARVEQQEAKPIEGLSVRVHQPLPIGERHRVYVRSQLGRPAVRVLQQPQAENDDEIRVLVDDGARPGAAPLHFELVAAPARPAPRPQNILIVTIDSLRADRLGSYGYDPRTSPHLDAFTQQSVRFANAFSTSSFTPPAHASLLTSRYVSEHGLLTWNELPAEQVTLPELLSRHDYRTGASVNLELLSRQGLGQGVEWKREGQRDGSVLVSDALEFVRDPDPRPWFLWLHLYDVHRPYKRITEATRTAVREERLWVGDVKEDYNLEPDEVRERALQEADLHYISDRYDAGVEYTDQLLAPLLTEMSTPERLADTLVVVTADHGESLLDHPEHLFTHDPFLYSAVTRIPLLIRYPGAAGAGEVRDELVSLIDLAPTALDVIGIAAPSTFVGLSLVDLGGKRELARDSIFQETWGWAKLNAVRTRDWLVVHDVKRGSDQVFDLAADPGELRPVHGALSAEAKALASRLEVFVRGNDGRLEPQLGAVLVEQLRALGYTSE